VRRDLSNVPRIRLTGCSSDRAFSCSPILLLQHPHVALQEAGVAKIAFFRRGSASRPLTTVPPRWAYPGQASINYVETQATPTWRATTAVSDALCPADHWAPQTIPFIMFLKFGEVDARGDAEGP
jgi:hypothetical protein